MFVLFSMSRLSDSEGLALPDRIIFSSVSPTLFVALQEYSPKSVSWTMRKVRMCLLPLMRWVILEESTLKGCPPKSHVIFGLGSPVTVHSKFVCIPGEECTHVLSTLISGGSGEKQLCSELMKTI